MSFKQGFFVNQADMKSWLMARSAVTGHQITIAEALTEMLKLSPDPIAKACKLRECR
jgi:hypothetical protein